MDHSIQKCPCCGGVKLVFGSLMDNLFFQPEEQGLIKWVVGSTGPVFRPKAFICPQCGFVGKYLDQEQLKQMGVNTKDDG